MRMLIRLFILGLAAFGAKTLYERFSPKDTSVVGQTLKLIAAKPDAIVIGASGTPAALPARTLGEHGYKGKLYFNHGVANSDFLRVGGLSAGYGRATVLSDIAFRLEEGCRFGRGVFGSRAMVGDIEPSRNLRRSPADLVQAGRPGFEDLDIAPRKERRNDARSRPEVVVGNQDADAFSVPTADEFGQVGVVPGVGVHRQHRPAADPASQVADTARRSQRLGLLDGEVHPAGQMRLQGGPPVVDVDGDRPGDRAGPSESQVDEGDVLDRAQGLGAQPGQRP